jgi:hypothetical protein
MKGTIAVFVLHILLSIFVMGCYIGNIVKLVKCDFASPYKGEIEHVIGIVVPPASIVTVWLVDK